MKRTLCTLAAVSLAASLAGCGTFAGEKDPTTGEDTALEVRRVQVDSRVVTCVVYRSYNRGGVSCDWAGAVAR